MASFPRRGEIWLVDFPDDPKSRPALIVSPNAPSSFVPRLLPASGRNVAGIVPMPSAVSVEGQRY